jgi:hypothetical protein
VSDEVSRAIVRGHCPDCDADRNAEVLAEDTREEELKASGVWGKSTYSILRCLGCDSRYIRLVVLCSEDWDWDVDPHTGETSMTLNERVTYWPSVPTPQTRRHRPEWLVGAYGDDLELIGFGLASQYPQLASLLNEVYTALDCDLHILATIGMRTVFDCASRSLALTLTKTSPKSLKNSLQGTR